jgi:hypothetical protein
MAQLWKIRMPDGRVLTPGDWTSAEPLYSTVEIGVGNFSVLSAFSFARGGQVPGSIGPRQANLADTNLEGEGARLPENEEIIIYQMGIEAFHIAGQSSADVLPPIDPPDVSLPNMLRLQRDLLIVGRIAYVKEYTRAPLSWFPASTGVHQYNSGARSNISLATTGYVSSNNGRESVAMGARQFASPLYVAGGESIAVDVSPGPGAVLNLDAETSGDADDGRLRLRLFWEGYRRRPVA